MGHKGGRFFALQGRGIPLREHHQGVYRGRYGDRESDGEEQVVFCTYGRPEERGEEDGAEPKGGGEEDKGRDLPHQRGEIGHYPAKVIKKREVD